MTKRWFSPFLRGKIILPRFFVIGITCFADIENASHKGPISLPSPLTGQVVDVNWELAREPDLVVNENWMAIILPEG